MKVAFFSDIHGNYIALQLLLAELKVQGVDQMYFLGDAVGYYPDGERVIRELEKNNVECVLGNHDAMVLGYIEINEERDAIYQNNTLKRTMSPDVRSILSKWLPFRIESIASKKVLLVHGSPFNPLLGYVYPDADMNIFNDLDFDMIVMGHTHRSLNLQTNNKRILNPGSAGQPREIGNEATYILWDTDADTFEKLSFKLPSEEILATYPNVHEKVRMMLKRNVV